MSLHGRFWDFIQKRVLLALLTLILSLFLTIISLSLISVGIFVANVIIFLIGSYLMFRHYEKERAIEKLLREEKFTKKLSVFFKEFKEKIADSGYAYSLVNIAFMIASNDLIQKRTKAWTSFLHSLLDKLDKKVNSLDEKLKKETTFSIAFEDFRNLLFLFTDFRTAFYSMVEETKRDKDFSQETEFQTRYKRLYEEYNNFMDRLRSFADDLKAEFDLGLSKDEIEHLKDLNILYQSY